MSCSITVIMMQKQTVVITSQQQFKVCQNFSWCNNPENHLVRTRVCVCVILSGWRLVILSRCLLHPQVKMTQARFHVLYLLRAQCFFCYISVHKKPHKVKVHIATVAPEFNVTPWPKQKSAKNRAQNSVQSISSLKITQGQKCSS